MNVYIYVAFLLLLLYMVASWEFHPLDNRMVDLCSQLISFSHIQSVEIELPCSIEGSGIIYGSARKEGVISRGVVVQGGHWAVP